jgi:chromosome segregation ATPase
MSEEKENEKKNNNENLLHEENEKSKEQIINLRREIEKIKNNYEEEKKDLTLQISQLKKENEELSKENEQFSKQNNNINKEIINQDDNQLIKLLKNFTNNILDMKFDIKNFEMKNKEIFKINYINLSAEEIKKKSKNWIEEINQFHENQIYNLTNNYEKTIQQLKEKIEDLEFSLEKNIFNLNEETIKNTELNEKIIGIEKRIEEYESILDSKDKIITFQKDNIELLNKKINEIQSLNNELEDNVNKSYLQAKMKEDEVDTLVMIIDGILGRRRDKYEHNLNRLSAETKQQIEEIVSEYEIFDDDE